jgi:hypothetical protein
MGAVFWASAAFAAVPMADYILAGRIPFCPRLMGSILFLGGIPVCVGLAARRLFGHRMGCCLSALCFFAFIAEGIQIAPWQYLVYGILLIAIICSIVRK